MPELPIRLPEEQHLTLSGLPPSVVQKRLALGAAIGLILLLLVTRGLLASVQLPRIDGLARAFGAAIALNDLLTAALLFSHFAILRSPALLALANGYLFTALTVIAWMLSLPGVFAPGGLLGAGLQTTIYLYVTWRAGFALFVIAYARLRESRPSIHSSTRPAIAIVVSCTAVIAAACVAVLLITSTDALLPPLSLDPLRTNPALWNYVCAAMLLVYAVALVLLWTGRRSALDIWLMVVLCDFTVELLMTSYPSAERYSMPWYMTRIAGLFASIPVLFVLLYELTTLYGRLLQAVVAQRREREARLVTGDAVAAMIAHEVKQPLAAMMTNAWAAIRWLDRPAPDVNEAMASLQAITADGRRVTEVIDSTRAIFKRHARGEASIDINDLIAEVLALVGARAQEHRISVQTQCNGPLPRVTGNPVQLRQVLSNLITNAIDSMAASTEARVLSIRSDVSDGVVLVSVADTGPGIPASDKERVFNPLFTTKTEGMGMGLAICRSIVEAHGGELSVFSNTPHGAVFRFTLRTDTPPSGAAAARTSQ